MLERVTDWSKCRKKTSWRKEDGDGNYLFVVYVLSELFILPLEQMYLIFFFTSLTFFALFIMWQSHVVD